MKRPFALYPNASFFHVWRSCPRLVVSLGFFIDNNPQLSYFLVRKNNLVYMDESSFHAQAESLALKFNGISPYLFIRHFKVTHELALRLCFHVWSVQAHEWFKWRMENK